MLPLLLSLVALTATPPAAHSAPVHMIADLPYSSDGICLGLPKSPKGGMNEINRVRIDAVKKRLTDLKLDHDRLLKPLKFRIVHQGRSNQHGGNVLTLSTACGNQWGGISNCPLAAGTIVHEVGHWIGNTMVIRGQTAYQAFKSSGTFRRCYGFVRYSSHFRNGSRHNNDVNETFAEVFSGYVTHPSFLKSACPAGYEFMREQIFQGQESICPKPAPVKPAATGKSANPTKPAAPTASAKPAAPLKPIPAATNKPAAAATLVPLPRPRPANLPR